MAREPWRITEQTEFLGQDMDSEPDQIAKGYVRRLVDLEPEGGAIRERDPLDKWNITWPEYYSPPIVGLARGRFFDDIYPTVVFVVDAAGYLYYLQAGQAPGSYDAHGLQKFWTNPTHIEAVQFIDRVVLTDGNAMVAGWAEGGAVKAELLETRPHPGVPRFSSGWDDTSYYTRVGEWMTDREYSPLCAVRYLLTYIWEDGAEGPPGPISEPYVLPAFQWDNQYNRPLSVLLPPVPIFEERPSYFRVYRAYSVAMGGIGDVGWQGFYEAAQVAVGLTYWTDTLTIPEELGAGPPPNVLSDIPAGKHLDFESGGKRLLIGNVKEKLTQQPSPGDLPWQRFGRSGSIPEGLSFAKRLAIDIVVGGEVVAYAESLKLRIQNSSPNAHNALSPTGAYAPIDDFASLWSSSSVSLNYVAFAITDSDGITPLPCHVAWASTNYFEVVVQVPELLPAVSRRIYLYYEAVGGLHSGWWVLNRDEMGLYLGLRRTARTNELFRMNCGLYPTNAFLPDRDRPACSAAGVDYAYIDLAGAGTDHAFDATDIRDAEVTTGDNIVVGDRLNKTRRTLTFDRDVQNSYWIYTTSGGTQIADLTSGSCCFWLFDCDQGPSSAASQEVFTLYDPGVPASEIVVEVTIPDATHLQFDVTSTIDTDSVTIDRCEELFVTVDWSKLDQEVTMRLWVPGAQPFSAGGGPGVLPETVTIDAVFGAMVNMEARFFWNRGVVPEPFYLRIGDLMMVEQRFTFQEECWEANMEPWAAQVTVDPEPEEIGVPKHHPNRGRYCEPSDLKSWVPLAYRDIGSEDHPINLVAVFEQNVGWCKPDGIYPMYLGSGAQLEFTDQGVLSETVFWNPQTLASDKRGYAGCSAPGAGVSTPDGVWMFSGNSIIRWDGQKIWDHTDGMRSQFVTSQAWRTETPVLFFWEPVRQNLMIAWKDSGAWRVAGVRQTFVKGNKVWGWFEHQGYQPAVISRSPGVVQGDLLLSDGATVYFFDQNLENGTYGTASPWVQLPDLRLVKGNVRGFGVSFSGAETMAASVFLDGQAVHSYTSVVSDRQYPVRRANARKFGLKLYGGTG